MFFFVMLNPVDLLYQRDLSTYVTDMMNSWVFGDHNFYTFFKFCVRNHWKKLVKIVCLAWNLRSVIGRNLFERESSKEFHCRFYVRCLLSSCRPVIILSACNSPNPPNKVEFVVKISNTECVTRVVISSLVRYLFLVRLISFSLEFPPVLHNVIITLIALLYGMYIGTAFQNISKNSKLFLHNQMDSFKKSKRHKVPVEAKLTHLFDIFSNSKLQNLFYFFHSKMLINGWIVVTLQKIF